jgi:hypothetical protein
MATSKAEGERMLRGRIHVLLVLVGLSAAAAIAACATGQVLTEFDASTGSDASTGTTDSGGDAPVRPADGGCLPTETKCLGACKDLKADPQNCGACGKACPSGSGCEQGVCRLACAPQTRCVVDGGAEGGVEACIDTRSNAAHCGSCNRACGSREYCDAGGCDLDCADAGTKCATDAGPACIDTRTTTAHCGGCNQPCSGSLVCVNGTCQQQTGVQIFPPTGTLVDPGNSSVWSARYYTVTLAQALTLTAIEWRAQLAATDSIRAQVWDPSTQVKLASGTNVTGNGTLAYYRSDINFAMQANRAYIIGIYMSNANTVFPRKNSPSYPFTVASPQGNISVTACWSTSTTNTDIFPTSTNTWGPDFRVYLQ